MQNFAKFVFMVMHREQELKKNGTPSNILREYNEILQICYKILHEKVEKPKLTLIQGSGIKNKNKKYKPVKLRCL